MGGILDFLGGPVKSLLEGAAGIIDKFVADPSEKLKAQQELLRMQYEFHEKMAEADAKFAAEQAKVLVAEAQSESWATRNWRPILMLVFTFIILYNFVLSPIASWASLPIPEQMWELLKIGIGGYIIGRSAENVASWLPDVMTAKNKK